MHERLGNGPKRVCRTCKYARNRRSRRKFHGVRLAYDRLYYAEHRSEILAKKRAEYAANKAA